MSVCLLMLTSCGACFSPRIDYGTVDNPRTTFSAVSVTRTIEGVVNIDMLLADVDAEIQEMLPGAYLRGIVFAGQARNLATLDGRIIFSFVHVHSRILGEQTITAGAAVDTEQQTLIIHTIDETGYYPSTERLDLDEGLPLSEIAAIACVQLEDMGFGEDEITLTRLHNNEWVVVCGEIGTLQQRCRFTIDATTGDIAIAPQ